MLTGDSYSMRSGGDAGLTAIERLTIVAAIAVLAGLLPSVIARVWRSGEKMRCLGIMRQGSRGLLANAKDHEAGLPRSALRPKELGQHCFLGVDPDFGLDARSQVYCWNVCTAKEFPERLISVGNSGAYIVYSALLGGNNVSGMWQSDLIRHESARASLRGAMPRSCQSQTPSLRPEYVVEQLWQRGVPNDIQPKLRGVGSRQAGRLSSEKRVPRPHLG